MASDVRVQSSDGTIRSVETLVQIADLGVAHLGEFGAQVWDHANPLVLPDNSPAFTAAVASMDGTFGFVNQPYCEVEAQTGALYISEPIWLKNSFTRLRGQGAAATIIYQSPNFPGGAGSGAAGFAGPMIMAGAPDFAPTWGPDLYGGSGRSIRLQPSQQDKVILSDAKVWRRNGTTDFTIEGRFKLNSLDNGFIISSAAYDLEGHLTNLAVSAFFVLVADTGFGSYIQAKLTTVNGEYTISGAGGSVSSGVTYDFRITYDGAHFRLWQNGTYVDGTAATGAVKQHCYEGVCIGNGFNDLLNAGFPCIDGWVQSVRLSNTARSTGTGNYTPSSTPLTADNNTLALYNWDQGDPADPDMPWVLGQVYTSYGGQPRVGLHYCRLPGGFNGEHQVQDLSLVCDNVTWGGSGIIFNGCYLSNVDRVYVFNATWMGLLHADAASFYSRHTDCFFQNCNIGYIASPYGSENITATGGGINAWVVAGSARALNAQPNSDTVYGLVFGGAGFGTFQNVEITSGSIDAEGLFPNLRAGAVFADCGIVTHGCQFMTNGSTAPGVLLSQGLPAAGWVSTADIFSADNSSISGFIECPSGSTISGEIVLDHRVKYGSGVPWTSSAEITRIVMPDLEDVLTSGTVTISGTDTTAAVSLSALEFAPQAYDIELTCGNPVGSPAAGSYIPFYSSKSSSGFTVNVTAAPGGGKSIDVGWHIKIR